MRHQTNTQRSWVEKCMQIQKRMRTHLRRGSQELGMPLNGRNEVCQAALGVPAFPWINLTNGMLMAPREGAPNVTIIAKSCPTLLVAWNRLLTVVEMARSTLLRRDRVGRPPATILARRRELTFSDFILIKAQQFEMKNRNAQEPIQNDNRRRELRKLWLQMLSKGPSPSENCAKHSPSTRQGRRASGNEFGQASRIDIF